MSEPYVLFQVDDTTYGIHSSDIQQLEMIEPVTRVPDAPEYVEGIVHLRGQVVPVMNMRRRFGLAPKEYDDAARLVVLRVEGRVVALAVDSAREFVRLDPEAISDPPEELHAGGSDYVRGVVLRDDRLILILDPRRVLGSRA